MLRFCATPPESGRLKVYDVDPMLNEFRDHLDYRYRRYREQLDAIVEAEGMPPTDAKKGKHGRLLLFG